MRWQPWMTRLSAVLVAGVSLVLCTSCVHLAPAPYDDYLGPFEGVGQPPSAVTNLRASAPGPHRPAGTPATRPATAAGPLDLTVPGAVLLALENNQGLRVERLNPPIRRTFEDQERAVFDPVASADLSYGQQRAAAGGGAGETTGSATTGTVSAGGALNTHLPTGADVALEAGATNSDSDPGPDAGSARIGLTFTQALLEGRGRDVNLASLEQARLDTLTSQYELRGFAESLVAQVEATYWDYFLAERRIGIYSESLKLAEQQLGETDERIKVGALAETERAAAQAEVALRREALINARSDLATTHIRLLRLVNPAGADAWAREVTLRDQPPALPAKPDSVEDHVLLALRMRPDVNQARLGVQQGDLELVKTKNGLLPKLDLFITLGKTGYAESFGRALEDLGGEGYEIVAGLRFSEAVGNRSDRARHQRALLNREQALEAVANLAQLVQVDVRSAHIEVNRAAEQVAATQATRLLQQEKLRAETEKFRVGRSTSLLVAGAQRDLVASQIAEVEAQVNHLKALIDLFRLDGSLLQRRGIAAPGREPVHLAVQPDAP